MSDRVIQALNGFLVHLGIVCCLKLRNLSAAFQASPGHSCLIVFLVLPVMFPERWDFSQVDPLDFLV